MVAYGFGVGQFLPGFSVNYSPAVTHVIFDVKKVICNSLLPAVCGWKPFVLADEIWGSLAIGLAIK
jgi:hypothetical protein